MLYSRWGIFVAKIFVELGNKMLSLPNNLQIDKYQKTQ